MTSHTTSVKFGEKVYEGKAKILYRGPENSLFHYFKDSATAFNAQKKAEFMGKGALNTAIATLLFGHLKQKGIPSHLIEQVDERTIRSVSLKMLPVEVVVRNRVAGSLAKRLGEKEGQPLVPPVVEWYFKDDAKGDPQVSEDVLISLYGIKDADLKEMRKLALEVNAALMELFLKGDLILVDFKLEFGKTEKGEILLGDEISPDTCRLWDVKTGEKWDKDRFRFDLGDLIEGYQVVLQRLKKALSS